MENDNSAFPPRWPETETYSVPETAHVIGVSVPTVYRLLARQHLKVAPHLRCKRVLKKSVRAFLNGEGP
jgi:hypothetical protein